ncbi:VirB4 family type IV secretion/conjugal transfer ATPase [Legionella sp.]|uniref:VirB4 family type IV secretion/conjugal transfer ATPase n=1 Tax=Legionella sp. TaxID=459 RepID=UPI003CBDF989
MNLSKIKSWVQKEVGVSRNIPITHLSAPDVFETQDGQLGAVLKIRGIPYLTTEAADLKRYQQTVHHALLQLGSEFMIMETVHRRFESTALSNKGFRNTFSESLHNKYHRQFSKGLYVNDIYLTVLYKPGLSTPLKRGLMQRGLSWMHHSIDKNVIELRGSKRAHGMNALNQQINQWMLVLNSFGVTRLGEGENGENQLIEFLSLVPNGGKKTKLSTASTYPIQANTVKQVKPLSVHYPRGHLGQYLANHRLFFGNAIQFQGNGQNEAHFGAMLSIKSYYRKTKPSSLDALLALDCEFIRTQTFISLELGASIEAIDSAQRKKISSEDHAASQVEELSELADLVASGKASVGLHHQTMMVLGKTQAQLDEAVSKATQAYASAFIPVVRESLGQDISFYAQIPGNSRFIARAAPITSENFADFCSLHNMQSGNREQCMLDEPITLVRTPQNTPVFLNYHKLGHPNNPVSGHSLIIGSNGSGKTALACFLDSEMNRFSGHRTFLLDRNEGAKIYIFACNGVYLKLDPTSQQEFTMNPLQLPDTAENREFCKLWVGTLLLDAGETGLDSSITEAINLVVNYGFDHLAPQDRTLSHIAGLFPIDFPRWPQLRRWLRAHATWDEGQYAWAFDNASDSLSLDVDKMGLDITYLMDSVPPHISAPFYMYILHRFKLSLTGQVTSFVFEEMWQALKAPFWSEVLEHYVPTIRKLYGHIVGLTQSPESIVNSPINHILLNNLASLIVFTNPSANKQVYVNELHLTPAEYHIVRSYPANARLMLYKQEQESILCHVDFSAIRNELSVLSGNVNSVRRMDELRQLMGRDAANWLPVFLEQNKCA